MTRRTFLPLAATVSALASAAQPVPRKGRLKQSAARSCFGRGATLDDICREAARLGLKGLDLVGPAEWPAMQKYGLLPTMVTGGGTVTDGINHKENHDALEKPFRQSIQWGAEVGAPNVIALSGNRRGLTDEQGLENSVAFLNGIKAIAAAVRHLPYADHGGRHHSHYPAEHSVDRPLPCRRQSRPS